METWKNNDDLRIIYEGKDEKDLPYPLYEENIDAILRSIFHNLAKRDTENDSSDESDRAHKWRERMDQQRESNIYSLVGARGAGKTTAMCEICRILDSLSNREQCKKWMEKVIQDDDDLEILKNHRFYFHVLDRVDAALLNDKEDLLELILSNLYADYKEHYGNSYYDEKWNQSVMMDINVAFEELLTLYRSTGNHEKDDYTIATFNRKGGNAAYLTRKIVELLGKIGKLKEDERWEDYYVIQIDDLDLNLRHGYEMIQQLQKYFCHYRILILITMDYEQLYYVCAEHFSSNMRLAEGEYTSENEISHSRILANDIMTKVFPISQRYFLPDMKKRSKRMQIVIPEADNPIPVKQYIMECIAANMRIHYDAIGHKRHFCEPNTVRQLVNYNRFLNALIDVNWAELEYIEDPEDIGKTKAEHITKVLLDYDHNHNRFNEDIVNRQAQTTLTANQRRFFKQFLDIPLERRADYFARASISPRLAFRDSFGGSSDEDYRYGTLLETIYNWGRNGYDNKPLVSCILASFTSEMVREHISYRYQPNPSKKEMAKERLLKFMGSSFGNKWLAERMFPEVLQVSQVWQSEDGNVEVKSERIVTVPIGFEENAEVEDVEILLKLDSLEELKEMMEEDAESWSFKLKEWFKDSGVIQLLEFMDSFLLKKKAGGEAVAEFQFRLGTTKWNKKSVIILGRTDDVKAGDKGIIITCKRGYCLDLMGFVTKSIDYGAVKKSLHTQFFHGLSKCLGQFFQGCTESWKINVIDKQIWECIKEFSVFQVREDNGSALFKTAFPFYDLDLAYNVLKRVANGEDRPITPEQICETLIQVYERIGVLLEEEERNYEHLNNRCTYAEDFRNSPYVYQLCGYKDSDERFAYTAEKNKKMRERISKLVYLMLSKTQKAGSPDEPTD